MSDVNRQLIDRIYELLKSDEILKSYVKSFSKGDMNASRKLSPFVSVGDLRYTVVPVTTGDDLYTYSIDILTGVRSLVPGLAFEGTDSGRKGIVQLCGDVAAVLRGNHLGGFLLKPISEIGISHGRGRDSSDFMQLGTVTIVAEIMVDRRNPTP